MLLNKILSTEEENSTYYINKLKQPDDNFDIKSFIPESFIRKYYAELGKNRKYEFQSFNDRYIIKYTL